MEAAAGIAGTGSGAALTVAGKTALARIRIVGSRPKERCVDAGLIAAGVVCIRLG